MNKIEFHAVFQICKMRIFEVNFHTIKGNSSPHFSTSAAMFVRNKRDYKQCGQCQEYVLGEPLSAKAMLFYEKWDKHHLSSLSDDDLYREMRDDLSKLSEHYNYMYTQEYRGFSFQELVEFSKQKVKK